jgi:hypothetical protein
MDKDVCDEINLYTILRYKDISIVSYVPILEGFLVDSNKMADSNKIIIPSIDNNFNLLNIRNMRLPTSWIKDQNFYILE